MVSSVFSGIGLSTIHKAEEVYWQQRGHLSWILKGDALNKYFFAIAHGRRRRCSIVRLVINDVVVSDANLIMSHFFSFFSSLLAAQPPSPLSISANFWPPAALISQEENESLLIPLSDSEIDEVVASSNSNSTTVPDGFSIPFFKKVGMFLNIWSMPLFRAFA